MKKPKTKVILCTVQDEHTEHSEPAKHPKHPEFKKDVLGPGICPKFSSYRVIQQGMKALFGGHEVYVANRRGDGARLASLHLGPPNNQPPR
ncbi:MAG: hypothetical protein RL033_1092 [Pseudomonadota bacterium]|jgi:hypothetical protein